MSFYEAFSDSFPQQSFPNALEHFRTSKNLGLCSESAILSWNNVALIIFVFVCRTVVCFLLLTIHHHHYSSAHFPNKSNPFSSGRIIPLVYTMLLAIPLNMSHPLVRSRVMKHHSQLDSNGLLCICLSRKEFIPENCTSRNYWLYEAGLQT